MCFPWNHDYKPYGIVEGYSLLSIYPVYGVSLRCKNCGKRKIIEPFSSEEAAQEYLDWLES